ncbi:Bifunctional hemolysin/adenylate cyclase [Methylobacterium bullatum]|uniref:Bifunctional hemolysin/adenylate cyclase n=1 Tax=Methylobacterium bullatum TaxID=570505 RepID=A0A679IL21_9HYPH|nr:Bifunctional hemolysin/adenylate cyclase [Methylobacterium bullatum]
MPTINVTQDSDYSGSNYIIVFLPNFFNDFPAENLVVQFNSALSRFEILDSGGTHAGLYTNEGFGPVDATPGTGGYFYDFSDRTGAVTIQGGDFGDIITGGAGVNTLSGGFGNDTLNGGAANDYLEGGEGADFIFGNGGVDTVAYTGSLAGVTVNLDTGINSGGDAGGDVLTGISRIIGSAHEDVLTGDGAANTLIGGSVYDSLFGGGGNDRLVVSGTPTIVDGGTGTDIMIVTGPSLFADQTFENIDKVYVRNSGSADFSLVTSAQTIVSQSTADNTAIIIGSQAGDRIYGGGGADILVGGAGKDKMFAGSGSDAFTYLSDLPGGFGRDNIYRFDALSDRFNVEGIVDSFAEVNIRSINKNQDTEITFATSTNPDDKIILHDVLSSTLTVDNFLI